MVITICSIFGNENSLSEKEVVLFRYNNEKRIAIFNFYAFIFLIIFIFHTQHLLRHTIIANVITSLNIRSLQFKHY